MGFSINIPLLKADENLHEVWGRATQEIIDRAGEIMDYESSKPLFQAWSDDFAKRTHGKSYGAIREQHDSKKAVGKIIEPLSFSDADKAIDIHVKVVDENTWRKVSESVLNSFSIGGSYEKTWTDEEGNLRYTARPTEISLVDEPACPTATIQFVKADGTTENITIGGKKSMNKDEFLKALSDGDLEKAFSFAEISAKVRNAIYEKKRGSYEYFWVDMIYPDSAIISMEGTADCYRIPYTISENGEVTLGEAEKVVCEWRPVGETKAEKALGSDDLQKNEGDSMSAEAKETEVVEKTAVEIEPKQEEEVKDEIKDDDCDCNKECKKRDFTAEERKKLAEEGKAMPDGSFPIENKEDLKNAIRLAGQAKDKKAAIDFICRRARALGAEDMIPEGWGKADKAVEAEGMTKADCQKEDIFEAVCKAMDKADDSIKEKCGKLFHKMVEKGLYCKCDKCTKAVEGEKAEKAAADTDLNKAVSDSSVSVKVGIESEELTKAMSVIEDLKKGLKAFKSANEALEKRVKKLEDTPVAGGAMVATGTMALDKTIGGSMGNPPANNSEEAMLRKMIDNADSPILKEAYSKQLAQLEMKKVFG